MKELNILWERQDGRTEVHAQMPVRRRAHPWQTACGLNWAGKRSLVVDRQLTCIRCVDALWRYQNDGVVVENISAK